jgi:hypothetical protein
VKLTLVELSEGGFEPSSYCLPLRRTGRDTGDGFRSRPRCPESRNGGPGSQSGVGRARCVALGSNPDTANPCQGALGR